MDKFTASRRAIRVSVMILIALALSACAGGGMASPSTPSPIEKDSARSAPAEADTVDPAAAQSAASPPEAKRADESSRAPRSAASDVGTMRAGPADEPVLIPGVSGNVEFWHFWATPVRRSAIRQVMNLCQERLPNIKVVDVVKPFGEIWTANLTAVAAQIGMPDVIVSDRPRLPRDAADGVYMSLRAWADRDNVERSQFYDWAWDQALYDGDVYGIPHETDISVLFYNKNLFRQAGLDPEKPPRTWAELEAAADKLDRIEDGEIKRMAFFPMWNRGTNVWQYTNDAEMVAADGTVRINNPRMVETVEWMKKWVDRYGGWEKTQSFHSQFGDLPNDIFMTSGLAMYVDIFGYHSALQFHRPTVTLDNGQREPLEWGIALLPYNKEPGTTSGGFAMSIPTGARNPAAGWEFIKCATGPQAQALWARVTQAQPTNNKAARDPMLLKDPAWEIVDQALRSSAGGIYLTEYPNWPEQLSQRWNLVWTGQLSPQQMLDEAQQAVEAAIE